MSPIKFFPCLWYFRSFLIFLQLFVFFLCLVFLNWTKREMCEPKRLMSGLCFSLLWGGQQGASERQTVGSLPGLLARAVPDAVILVHHLLQQRLVVGVEWCHRDVPHRTKLTTVIQVLVFQTEEVPHKTSAEGRVTQEEIRTGNNI